jgi:hypothetical protein
VHAVKTDAMREIEAFAGAYGPAQARYMLALLTWQAYPYADLAWPYAADYGVDDVTAKRVRDNARRLVGYLGEHGWRPGPKGRRRVPA